MIALGTHVVVTEARDARDNWCCGLWYVVDHFEDGKDYWLSKHPDGPRDLVCHVSRVKPVRGWYVMTWGADRYTSTAYYAAQADALAEVARIRMVGAWRGMPPMVEAAT